MLLYKVHMRLGIVTSEEHANLLPDESALARALAGHGIDAVPAVWTNTAEHWSGFEALLIRHPVGLLHAGCGVRGVARGGGAARRADVQLGADCPLEHA